MDSSHVALADDSFLTLIFFEDWVLISLTTDHLDEYILEHSIRVIFAKIRYIDSVELVTCNEPHSLVWFLVNSNNSAFVSNQVIDVIFPLFQVVFLLHSEYVVPRGSILCKAVQKEVFNDFLELFFRL